MYDQGFIASAILREIARCLFQESLQCPESHECQDCLECPVRHECHESQYCQVCGNCPECQADTDSQDGMFEQCSAVGEDFNDDDFTDGDLHICDDFNDDDYDISVKITMKPNVEGCSGSTPRQWDRPIIRLHSDLDSF